MLRLDSRPPAVPGTRRPSRRPVLRELPLLLFLLLLAVPAFAATQKAAVAPARPDDDGTRRMAERLATLQAEREAGSGWDAVLALEALEGQPLPDDPRARAAREVELAMWTLLAGDAAAAVERLERLAASPAAAEMAAAAAQGPYADGPGADGPGSGGPGSGGPGSAGPPAPDLDALRALAWLRLGELENCVDHHNSASCLLPIRGDGVHRLRRGSERAAELFLRVLERNPDDLVARWLLNLAHQTLGSWPDGVPEPFRIGPEVFASEAAMPAFRDVAAVAGVAVVDHAGGGVLEDFDGDGLLDLVVSSWRLADPIRFLRNGGDGRFEDRTAAAGLEGLTGGLNLVHADYDNDGDRDVLVLRGAWRGRLGRFPNSLLRNEGDGTFTDVTEAAGVLSFHPTQTAAWADFDGDGWLDLFVGNESTPGEVHPCELYRNRGDGTFQEVGARTGAAAVGFVKGVAAGDYDGDGRPDLYLSRLGQPNVLLRNEAVPGVTGMDAAAVEAVPPFRFRDVTAEAGVAEPLFSFPTAFLDADGDGDLDLLAVAYGPRALPPGMMAEAGMVMRPEMFRQFVGHMVADYLGLPSPGDTPRLYRNRGDGTFEDATAAAGLDRILYAMGANFGDLDGDARPDLYLGTGDPSLESLTPNRALWNAGDGTFRDVTTASRLGHVQKGHAVSFGDVDNDGDQDLHAVLGGAFEGDVYANALFENPAPPAAWIKLDLVGTRSNRDALGARLVLTVQDTAGTVRRIHDHVTPGASFGASTLRREIGLGGATLVRTVEVHWPSGLRQTFRNLEPGALYRLTEGDAEPRVRPLPSFRFPEDAAHHAASHGHSGHGDVRKTDDLPR